MIPAVRTFRVFMGGLAACWGLSQVEGAELQDFIDYVQVHVQTVEQRYQKKMKPLEEMYINSIRSLSEEARRAGNLDQVLRFNELVKTFEEEGPKEMGPPLTENPDFLRLQDTWLRIRRERRAERARALLEIYDRYDIALEKLQRRLTQENEIDQAMQVQAERGRIREDPRMDILRGEAARPEKTPRPAAGPLPPLLTVLGPDMVLYYSFDHDSGARIRDRSLKRNHGQARAVEWRRNGVVGGGVYFDGENSVIDAGNPESLQITGDLTIAFWIQPEIFQERRNPLNKSYGGEMTMTQEIDGRVNFYYGTAGKDTDPYQGVTTPEPIQSGAWTHLCLVRDHEAKEVVWYINGREVVRAEAQFAEAAASNQPLLLGRGYVSPFKGMMDEVIILSRALDERDVQRLYRTLGGK